MINYFINKLKYNWVDILLLAFNLTLFIIFSNSLIAYLFEHKLRLKSIALLIWIFVFIAYVIKSWQNLTTNNKQENRYNIISNPIFSGKWFTEDFPAIIAITVVYIPIVILFVIVFTNDEITKTIVVSDPNFETTGDWANILLGIGFFSKSITEVVEIEHQATKKLLSFINDAGLLLGFIFYIIWTVHLTEVR